MDITWIISKFLYYHPISNQMQFSHNKIQQIAIGKSSVIEGRPINYYTLLRNLKYQPLFCSEKLLAWYKYARKYFMDSTHTALRQCHCCQIVTKQWEGVLLIAELGTTRASTVLCACNCKWGNIDSWML